MTEAADNLQPEWVRETRKRLRHEQLLQQEDEARRLAWTKEREKQIADELRASYLHYDRDLKGIQRSIEGAVQLLKVGETCWVFLRDTCADIRIYGLQQLPDKDGLPRVKPGFRLVSSWDWGRVMGEKPLQPVIFALMAIDLAAWAKSLGLDAKADQCAQGTVDVPFLTYRQIAKVDEIDYHVHIVAIQVPL